MRIYYSHNMTMPQGGSVSPLLSNLYLTEVDRMRAKLRVEVFRSACARRWTWCAPMRSPCSRTSSATALPLRVFRGLLQEIRRQILCRLVLQNPKGHRDLRLAQHLEPASLITRVGINERHHHLVDPAGDQRHSTGGRSAVKSTRLEGHESRHLVHIPLDVVERQCRLEGVGCNTL